MSKMETLRVLLNARLGAAVEEVLGVFQRTIAEYEEELARTKDENETQRRQLAAVCVPRVGLQVVADNSDKFLPPEGQDEQRGPNLDFWPKSTGTECSSPLTFRERSSRENGWMDEQHEWNLRLERQHLREKKHSAGAMDECPLTAGPVKIEEGAPRSRLRRGRWAEPSRSSSSSSSSSSSQHVTTEAYRDHCGGLQAESLLAPPSSDGDGTTLESKDGNQEHLPPERQDDHSGACPVLSSTSAGTGRNPPVTLMRMSDIENGGTGEQRDWNSGLGREQEQHVKEEENAAVIAALKTNDDNGPRSRLHPSQSGEKRWAEPPSGGMKSEDGGGQRGGSRAGGLFPPVSLDTVDGRAQGDATSRGRDARWKCSRCGETFGAKKNLRRHAVLHAREQPLGFSRCQRLPPKANLITWARAQPPSSCSHHSASTNGKKTHAGGEKPFQCSVCSQTFSKKQNMMTHMRIHTGERPFACSTCGARFTQKISLTHHLRTHTGEKPFSCSECNKGFAHPSAHLRHMKLHTRVKPHVCQVCGQAFARKDHFKKHMMTNCGEVLPDSCTLRGPS